MTRRRNRGGIGQGGPGGPDYRDLEPAVNSAINAFSRLDARLQIVIVALLLVAGVVAFITYQRQQRLREAERQPQQPPVVTGPGNAEPARGRVFGADVNMLLGNPSGATADASNRDNYLMVKPYYALAYDNSAGTAKWVSWRVAREDLGDAPRKQLFDPDSTLPAGFYRVVHKDYSGSGFDRGHLCPHSDRAATTEMSYATFVMTNIIPQAPNVNQKAWANFETYCRDEVSRRRQRLYVVAGPNGRGGTGSNGFTETIAHGKVTVPAQCWKVVVEVPESGGDDDRVKINSGSRVIAVMMPNDETAVGEEWAKYRTSPGTIERATGLRFFDALPSDVAGALREKVDGVSVPRPGSSRRGRGGE